MRTPVRMGLFLALVGVASLFNSTVFYTMGLIEEHTARIVISVLLGIPAAYAVTESLIEVGMHD